MSKTGYDEDDLKLAQKVLNNEDGWRMLGNIHRLLGLDKALFNEDPGITQGKLIAWNTLLMGMTELQVVQLAQERRDYELELARKAAQNARNRVTSGGTTPNAGRIARL